MNFLTQLRLDKEQKSEEWENDEITSYLEGICSWVDDMEGYFDNMHIEMPTDIDWRFIAMFFIMRFIKATGALGYIYIKKNNLHNIRKTRNICKNLLHF